MDSTRGQCSCGVGHITGLDDHERRGVLPYQLRRPTPTLFCPAADCAPDQADDIDGGHTPSSRLAPGAATDHHGRSHRLHSLRPNIRPHRFSESRATITHSHLTGAVDIRMLGGQPSTRALYLAGRALLYGLHLFSIRPVESWRHASRHPTQQDELRTMVNEVV
jgi:hypothetical protein